MRSCSGILITVIGSEERNDADIIRARRIAHILSTRWCVNMIMYGGYFYSLSSGGT